MNDARVFPPSKYIKDQLDERGWSQTDLAFILGRGYKDTNDIISGKRKLTPEIAQELAVAFGTSAEYWLNLENKFKLSQTDYVDDAVIKRSKLFNAFPAKEMIKRGWIPSTDNVHELEQSFLHFFGISSLDEKPKLSYAALKSSSYSDTTIEQAAWLNRAQRLAPVVMVKKFSDKALSEALEKLRMYLFDVEEIRHVPRTLAEAGVRLLLVEPLPSSKIDGATFWLDKQSPVIVLSLRFDRIDNFWHTLSHELSHVKNREGQDEPIIDKDLLNEDSPATDRPEYEQRADRDAAEFSIPAKKLDSFILRVHPSYTEQKILGFSALNKVHAGIVVGQLHHRFRTTGKGLPFSYQRKFLVKVRSVITDAAFTDGWGHIHSI